MHENKNDNIYIRVSKGRRNEVKDIAKEKFDMSLIEREGASNE